jgi:hypothetical protein
MASMSSMAARKRWLFARVRGVVVHRFAELVAPSRLGRSFRWLLASSWVTNLADGITPAPTAEPEHRC